MCKERKRSGGGAACCAGKHEVVPRGHSLALHLTLLDPEA